jgi:hypothetical protein
MKSIVLKFPRARFRRKRSKQRRLHAEATSIELVKIVDNLRSDLRSIDNAIRAIEYLAAVELGEDISHRRDNRPRSKGKIGLIALSQMPPRQTDFRPAEPEQASGC